MKIIVTLDKQQLTINTLKAERTALKKALPFIKHTVKQHQAKKKYKFLDYVIGRMVFFEEDYTTASKTAIEHKKAGII